ncbi:MAG: glycosyltransferase family 2 protein [Bacteroides sp.]|nr:glycosyltransferase family 2 protein [Bacteroides sp.]
MIAVVILNWNGREMLQAYLPAVVKDAAAMGGERVTVYVADNASTDGSLEMLRREFPGVRRIELDRNYGFAEGYNRALAEVEAEYVVLLNSDVLVTPEWLLPLQAYMDTHPDVAACQPKIHSLRRPGWFEYAGAAGGFVDRYGYPFCRGRIMGVTEEDRGQYDTPCTIFWATGAALFVRLEAYRRVGGLDGRFFAHMEEIDLCWRFRARGMGVACVPSSCVNHWGGATLKRENPHKTFLNFRNNLLMLYKNLPDDELRPVMRVRALLDYVAALKYFLTGDWANGRAVIRARRDYRRLRPSFLPSRCENLQKSMEREIPERTRFSILWQFYFKGKKHYHDLRLLS